MRFSFTAGIGDCETIVLPVKQAKKNDIRQDLDLRLKAPDRALTGARLA